jgi:myo-inositol-1(or 4)-monophosphatase
VTSPPTPGPDGPLADTLVALAVELAEAGAELLAASQRAAGVVVADRAPSDPDRGAPRWASTTKSSPTDHVTDADRASERLIVEGIRRARPDDAILGEEGTSQPGTSGLRWVIDPLDGTTNFVYGLPAYGVSIAVERDGVALAGVVVDAARAETFSATAGGGAWSAGVRLRCNHIDDLSLALVGTGFSYDAARRARQGKVVAGLLPRIRDLRRVGAAALDLCWVACGRLDAFYEAGLQPWDLAAGALIAREAGADVTDLAGDAPSGQLALAANPALAARIRELLGELGDLER